MKHQHILTGHCDDDKQLIPDLCRRTDQKISKGLWDCRGRKSFIFFQLHPSFTLSIRLQKWSDFWLNASDQKQQTYTQRERHSHFLCRQETKKPEHFLFTKMQQGNSTSRFPVTAHMINGLFLTEPIHDNMSLHHTAWHLVLTYSLHSTFTHVTKHRAVKAVQ